MRVPVDDEGRVVIDLRGPWGRDGFDSMSAAQVMEFQALSAARETYLCESQDYLALRRGVDGLRRRGLDRQVGLGAGCPLGPDLAVLLARAPLATLASWLDAQRRDAGRDLLAKLGLDVMSLVGAIDEARKTKDGATEREAQVELDRLAFLHEKLMIQLPLLEDELKRKLDGKFCLVGVTATSTTDIAVVPLDERYINLGIHVNVLNQLLGGSTLRRASPWTVDLPLLMVYALLLPALLGRLSIRKGAALALGLVVGHALLATLLLTRGSLWIQVAVPVLAIVSGYSAITMRRYLLEERQKLKIREMFETYLDPKVVEMMVDDESLWRELGGTVREITPFFSDLAGFSTISELLGPEELSDMLVDYLTPMTEIVLRHGGIRERYVGDAIVAFFGAPVVFPDHARKACLASLEQREALVSLRRRWWNERVPWYLKVRAAGLDLDFRIGLATGQAKVGNFGSKHVKNYSMNGDVVNLAARLEGANKFYGTGILCTDATLEAASDAVEAREIDLLKVVGKKNSARIFELVGRKGQLSPRTAELLSDFAAALDLYRTRRFDQARVAFEAIATTNPGDGPTRTYLERLADREALATLPDDWDGSWIALTK